MCKWSVLVQTWSKRVGLTFSKQINCVSHMTPVKMCVLSDTVRGLQGVHLGNWSCILVPDLVDSYWSKGEGDTGSERVEHTVSYLRGK